MEQTIYTRYEIIERLKKERDTHELFDSNFKLKTWSNNRLYYIEKRNKIKPITKIHVVDNLKPMNVYSKNDWEIMYQRLIHEYDKLKKYRGVEIDEKDLLSTTDIAKILEREGIYITSISARINHVRDNLDIRPAKRAKYNNMYMYTKEDAQKILDVIREGYRGDRKIPQNDEQKAINYIESVVNERNELKKENQALKEEIALLKEDIENLKQQKSTSLISKILELCK